VAHIFIGDIHGCIDEVNELLSLLAPSPDDSVISVGDLVDKGPDPAACIRLWRESGYLAVRGNAEEKLLDQRSPSNAALGLDDLTYVERLPLYLDMPEAGVIVVHGGLFPDQNLAEAELLRNREALLKLRFVRRKGPRWKRVPRGRELPGDVFWASLWRGDRTVVYGHHPTQDGKPRIDKQAIGLDTGCVYGGFLTAAILDGNAWDFVSFPARKAYFPI